MTGEEKLNEFLEAIETWKLSKQLPPVGENDNINRLINLRSEDIRKLRTEECAFHAYELYAYAEYLEAVRTKEKIVLDRNKDNGHHTQRSCNQKRGSNTDPLFNFWLLLAIILFHTLHRHKLVLQLNRFRHQFLLF